MGDIGIAESDRCFDSVILSSFFVRTVPHADIETEVFAEFLDEPLSELLFHGFLLLALARIDVKSSRAKRALDVSDTSCRVCRTSSSSMAHVRICV